MNIVIAVQVGAIGVCRRLRKLRAGDDVGSVDGAGLLFVLCRMEIEEHPRPQNQRHRLTETVHCLLFCLVDIDLQRAAQQPVGDLQRKSAARLRG